MVELDTYSLSLALSLSLSPFSLSLPLSLPFSLSFPSLSPFSLSFFFSLPLSLTSFSLAFPSLSLSISVWLSLCVCVCVCVSLSLSLDACRLLRVKRRSQRSSWEGVASKYKNIKDNRKPYVVGSGCTHSHLFRALTHRFLASFISPLSAASSALLELIDYI